jgi:GNAT superfamily N-acetyltransferase
MSGAGRQAEPVAAFLIRPRTDADLTGVADLLLATHHSDAYPVVVPDDLVAWGAADDVLAAWVAVDPGRLDPADVDHASGGDAWENEAEDEASRDKAASAEGNRAGRGAVVGHVVLTEVDGGPATAQWVEATGRLAPELAVVRRLVVHRRAHRTGTGRALLATAVDAAHALGRRPVLDMADNLDAARGLYVTAGFDLIGAYDLVLAGHPLHVLTWIGPEPPPRSRTRPAPQPG